MPHGRGVCCGLVFQQLCNLLLVKENSGCSDLALFYVCKAKVCICAVLDSAKVEIVWVALCFTPFSFTIAALKMRQLEQSRVLLRVGSSDLLCSGRTMSFDLLWYPLFILCRIVCFSLSLPIIVLKDVMFCLL